MNWITAHWLQISAISAASVAVISEIMPFLPTKYDGILDAIVGILGKIPAASPKI